jgi:hypothetical protein
VKKHVDFEVIPKVRKGSHAPSLTTFPDSETLLGGWKEVKLCQILIALALSGVYEAIRVGL